VALVTKTLSQISNGAAYVEIDYQDTNELVEEVRWANNLPTEVLCIVKRADTGATVLNTRLQPGASGFVQFSGGDRFKMEFYEVNLAS
jgi:hypothetical protein